MSHSDRSPVAVPAQAPTASWDRLLPGSAGLRQALTVLGVNGNTATIAAEPDPAEPIGSVSGSGLARTCRMPAPHFYPLGWTQPHGIFMMIFR